MHLKSSCFKFVHSNHLIRSSFSKVVCITRNDERQSTRVISLSGQVFYKPLYIAPKPCLLQEKDENIQLQGFFTVKVDESEGNCTMGCDSSEKEAGFSILLGEPRTILLSYCRSCYLSCDFKGFSAILSDSKLNTIDSLCMKPVEMLYWSPLYLVQPSNAVGHVYLTVRPRGSNFRESLLLLSEHNAGTREKHVDQPQKATETQLLAVKEHICQSFLNFFSLPHNFSIYRNDIEFQNNISAVTTKGIAVYMVQMYLLKFYGHLYYAKVKFEILKVTYHTDDCTVRVRWRVNGISRRKLLFNFLLLREKGWKDFLHEYSEWLDGFSVFSVDRVGLVYKHVCDKMIPDEEHLSSKPLTFRSRLLTLLGLVSRSSPVGSAHCISCSAMCHHLSLKSSEKTAGMT